jgi:hypothetical protein
VSINPVPRGGSPTVEPGNLFNVLHVRFVLMGAGLVNPKGEGGVSVLSLLRKWCQNDK